MRFQPEASPARARKHLQVLAEAKFITLQPRGRETEVKLDIASLDAARTFITELERQWDSRLAALRDFVESEIAQEAEADTKTTSKPKP